MAEVKQEKLKPAKAWFNKCLVFLMASRMVWLHIVTHRAVLRLVLSTLIFSVFLVRTANVPQDEATREQNEKRSRAVRQWTGLELDSMQAGELFQLPLKLGVAAVLVWFELDRIAKIWACIQLAPEVLLVIFAMASEQVALLGVAVPWLLSELGLIGWR
jgi:hypothetical protein